MFTGISFFGVIHQSGGCGPELLGALDLLQSKGIEVRCILPKGDKTVTGDRARYLFSRGIEVLEYIPGLFSQCSVLMSFGEDLCFEYMREHSDRPKRMVWSSCMLWAVDREVKAHNEGLIDEFFFQTEETAKKVVAAIKKRTKKSVPYRSGYLAHINPNSDYGRYRDFVMKDPKEFRVCKAVRDDHEKWHEDTWRMFCGIVAPTGRKVQTEVAGWGPNAEDKIGNPCNTSDRWSGLLDITLHSHIVNPVKMAELYGRAHVLLHYYPFEENYPRATLQAMLARAVPIAEAKGGFIKQIQHGDTGFLATSPEEASYYASKLAFEKDTWKRMSEAAAKWVVKDGPGNPAKCWPWWKELLQISEISF